MLGNSPTKYHTSKFTQLYKPRDSFARKLTNVGLKAAATFLDLEEELVLKTAQT